MLAVIPERKEGDAPWTIPLDMSRVPTESNSTQIGNAQLNAVLSKTILKKLTGNITVSSFDAGEELPEKSSPFDNYIQMFYYLNNHFSKQYSTNFQV